MQSVRSSNMLVRWSALLAACGALILAAGFCFFALALWHHSLAGDYGATHVIVSAAPLALFSVGSAVVLVAALFVRHIAGHRHLVAAKRLSHIAAFGTMAGWFAIGATLFWLWCA